MTDHDEPQAGGPAMTNEEILAMVTEQAARNALLRHTDECMAYAGRTGAKSGVWWCIAPCGRLRNGEITAAEYKAEVSR